MSEASKTSSQTAQVDHFCNQYLQLEKDLDYPQPSFLREQVVQQAIYARLFAPASLRYAPPDRYKIRVLKDLVKKVEGSIEDWDVHVSEYTTRSRPNIEYRE